LLFHSSQQEAKDEVSSIDVSGAVTNKGEAVKRRTSITRKSAFRRRSTKGEQPLHLQLFPSLTLTTISDGTSNLS